MSEFLKSSIGVYADSFKMTSLQTPEALHREFSAALAMYGITKSQFYISLMRALVNGDLRIELTRTLALKAKIDGDMERYIFDKTVKIYTNDGILINPTDALVDLTDLE